MRHPPPQQSLFAPLRALEDDDRSDAAEPDDVGSESRPAGGQPSASSVLAELPRMYVCPGERHAIPRSVHLARLAAFYPNCRHCEHRTDTGQLTRSTIERLERTVQRAAPVSLFQENGIRGPYLNQMTRKTGAQLATAVADRLWADQPLVGRRNLEIVSEPSTLSRRTAGPTVAIGHDSRPASPDICVGVSESLRRMGCDVVDVGRVSRPCLTFAVDHLSADAGLYITGCGSPNAWAGIDVFGARGIPWSVGGTLDDVERRFHLDPPRPTRQGGMQRFFDASIPYRASLLKHFQGLPPRRVLCICVEPCVADSLTLLFDGLPCELLSLPPDTVLSGKEPTTTTLQEAIRQASADCGVVIGDDGASLQLYMGDGRPVSAEDLLRRVLPCAGPVRSTIPMDSETADAHGALFESLGSHVEIMGPEAESIARWMDTHAAPCGVQSGGRLWLRDPFPQCDAIVTLGRLLQSLALEDVRTA
ncbi:MAG: hypothetical protein KF861_13835 [Planctomycetaceae bacterium]|nr:hypothetical protein [Planctomycetaceae bacterium]